MCVAAVSRRIYFLISKLACDFRCHAWGIRARDYIFSSRPQPYQNQLVEIGGVDKEML